VQTALVVLLVLLSALFAAGRVLPRALVSRALAAIAAFNPALGRVVGRVAGQRQHSGGATLVDACEGCSNADAHRPAVPRSDSSVNQ
jgi:hypothetical protein